MKVIYYVNNMCAGSIERDPICGYDFCEYCGDCLYCYGSDSCYNNDNSNHSDFSEQYITVKEFEEIRFEKDFVSA